MASYGNFSARNYLTRPGDATAQFGQALAGAVRDLPGAFQQQEAWDREASLRKDNEAQKETLRSAFEQYLKQNFGDEASAGMPPVPKNVSFDDYMQRLDAWARRKFGDDPMTERKHAEGMDAFMSQSQQQQQKMPTSEQMGEDAAHFAQGRPAEPSNRDVMAAVPGRSPLQSLPSRPATAAAKYEAARVGSPADIMTGALPEDSPIRDNNSLNNKINSYAAFKKQHPEQRYAQDIADMENQNLSDAMGKGFRQPQPGEDYWGVGNEFANGPQSPLTSPPQDMMQQQPPEQPAPPAQSPPAQQDKTSFAGTVPPPPASQQARSPTYAPPSAFMPGGNADIFNKVYGGMPREEAHNRLMLAGTGAASYAQKVEGYDNARRQGEAAAMGADLKHRQDTNKFAAEQVASAVGRGQTIYGTDGQAVNSFDPTAAYTGQSPLAVGYVQPKPEKQPTELDIAEQKSKIRLNHARAGQADRSPQPNLSFGFQQEKDETSRFNMAMTGMSNAREKNVTKGKEVAAYVKGMDIEGMQSDRQLLSDMGDMRRNLLTAINTADALNKTLTKQPYIDALNNELSASLEGYGKMAGAMGQSLDTILKSVPDEYHEAITAAYTESQQAAQTDASNARVNRAVNEFNRPWFGKVDTAIEKHIAGRKSLSPEEQQRARETLRNQNGLGAGTSKNAANQGGGTQTQAQLSPKDVLAKFQNPASEQEARAKLAEMGIKNIDAFVATLRKAGKIL